MGQGAAMAVEDAVSMATMLPLGTSPADVHARLKLYEEARRDRVEMVLNYTRIAGLDPEEETEGSFSGKHSRSLIGNCIDDAG
jgi:salicylate hydroxylase